MRDVGGKFQKDSDGVSLAPAKEPLANRILVGHEGRAGRLADHELSTVHSVDERAACVAADQGGRLLRLSHGDSRRHLDQSADDGGHPCPCGQTCPYPVRLDGEAWPSSRAGLQHAGRGPKRRALPISVIETALRPDREAESLCGP